ncbi:MAG: flagellar basal body L-ring protein FlgH [Legionellaceae bacterium]|nr:flagellar basal body L-ring protein FlgH [Legionellaceae bacterium]
MRRSLFLLLLCCLSSASAVNLFDSLTYRPLTGDRRAAFPGDLLTVLVMETSNAESAADLASRKDISTALSASYNAQSVDVSLGLAGQGKAAAKTGRNGKIKAALTVRIQQVLEDGNFLVSGTQRIVINEEEQIINLSGLVRREDISAQNTLLSTRLADAKITYSGLGSVSNAQHYNHLYKVLSFLGLV